MKLTYIKQNEYVTVLLVKNYSLFYVLVKRVEGTHSAEGLKLFVRDKTSIQAKQEDRGVGEHASEDDQVVHVGTGHLD